MKLKSALYLVPLFLISYTGFSQSGFIEVEVSDVVLLKATSFEYAVTIGNDYSYGMPDIDTVATDYNEDINEAKQKANQKMRLNELETFLKQKKYNYSSLSESNLEVKGLSQSIYGSAEGYKVKVASLDQLKKLIGEIKEMNNINGSILDTTFEDGATYDTVLLKKLIDKAKSEAQLIASSTNQVLGKIIEVKEMKEAENSNLNFMDMIMKLSVKSKLLLNQDVPTKNYYKGYTVKFKTE